MLILITYDRKAVDNNLISGEAPEPRADAIATTG